MRKIGKEQNEMDFQNAIRELVEAVNDTEGMDPKAAEENKTILLQMIQDVFEIPVK